MPEGLATPTDTATISDAAAQDEILALGITTLKVTEAGVDIYGQVLDSVQAPSIVKITMKASTTAARMTLEREQDRARGGSGSLVNSLANELASYSIEEMQIGAAQLLTNTMMGAGIGPQVVIRGLIAAGDVAKYQKDKLEKEIEEKLKYGGSLSVIDAVKYMGYCSLAVIPESKQDLTAAAHDFMEWVRLARTAPKSDVVVPVHNGVAITELDAAADTDGAEAALLDAAVGITKNTPELAKDKTIQAAAADYEQATEAEKPSAFVKFREKTVVYLTDMKKLDELSRDVEHVGQLCGHVARLTKNQDVKSFAIGIDSVSKAMQGYSAAKTALDTISENGMSLAGATAFIGGVGLVIGAVSMISSLVGGRKRRKQAQALQQMFAAIQAMHKDVVERLDVIDWRTQEIQRSVFEMETHNWLRFWYTVGSLRSVEATITERLDRHAYDQLAHQAFSAECLRSYLRVRVDRDRNVVVSNVLGADEETIRKNYVDWSSRLYEELTTTASSIDDRVGKYRTDRAALYVDEHFSQLKETTNPLDVRMGFYYDLIAELVPEILSQDAFDPGLVRFNPVAWGGSLPAYLTVLYHGRQVIACLPASTQEGFWIARLRVLLGMAVKQRRFFAAFATSLHLWQRLTQRYDAAIDALRTAVEQARASINAVSVPTLPAVKTFEQVFRGITVNVRLGQGAITHFPPTKFIHNFVALEPHHTHERTFILTPDQLNRLSNSFSIMRGFLNNPYFSLAINENKLQIELDAIPARPGRAGFCFWDYCVHFIVYVCIVGRRIPIEGINLFREQYDSPWGKWIDINSLTRFDRSDAVCTFGPAWKTFGNAYITEADRGVINTTLNELQRTFENTRQGRQTTRQNLAREAANAIRTSSLVPLKTAYQQLVSCIKLIEPTLEVRDSALIGGIEPLIANLERTGDPALLNTLRSQLSRVSWQSELNALFGAAALMTTVEDLAARMMHLYPLHPLWRESLPAYQRQLEQFEWLLRLVCSGQLRKQQDVLQGEVNRLSQIAELLGSFEPSSRGEVLTGTVHQLDAMRRELTAIEADVEALSGRESSSALPSTGPKSAIFPFFARPNPVRRLTAIAQTYGHRIEDVAGDGNCQFHALLIVLRNAGRVTESMTAQALREAAIAYIGEHEADFVEFLDGESMAEYCARMRQSSSYGDHLTLTAISEHYRVNIIAFDDMSHNGVRAVIKPRVHEPETTICLALRTDGSGNELLWHYQALLPAADTGVEATASIDDLLAGSTEEVLRL